MPARILNIEEKLRSHPGAVRPSDFRLSDGGAVDSGVVLRDPHLSLYCLDFEGREALFVQTPPGCDLSRAPFLYLAQYEAAQRLISVPFDTLHRLAQEVVIDPSRLILIYSVGRCGSTLVSHAFACLDHVESLSEPDVFTQMLGTWGADELDAPGGEEKADLLRICTLLQCVPGTLRGSSAWALKFRSMVARLWPLFYQVFPEARVVFLYRAAEPWARSFLRMIRAADPSAPVPVAGARMLFGRAPAAPEGRETATPLEVAAWNWRSIMEACLAMQRQGLDVFAARYEELSAAPEEVLSAMFSHCGLAGSKAVGLEAVLAQDSQEGTPLSRESLGGAPVQITPEHLKELRRLIAQGAPGAAQGSQALTADTILPETYLPAPETGKQMSIKV